METPDSLKKYIKNHQLAFEEESPNPLLFDKIKEKLSKQKPKPVRLYPWLAAACTLLCLYLGWWILQPTKPELVQTPLVLTPIEKQLPQQEVTTEKTISPHKIIQSQKQAIKRIAIAPNTNQTIDPIALIIAKLNDSTSVASRLNAILELGTFKELADPLKNVLCTTFSHDQSSLVRLAALEILAKRPREFESFLQTELTKQEDPNIQLALVNLVGNSKDELINKQLWQIANNHSNIEMVKNQAYYTLITNTFN